MMERKDRSRPLRTPSSIEREKRYVRFEVPIGLKLHKMDVRYVAQISCCVQKVVGRINLLTYLYVS